MKVRDSYGNICWKKYSLSQEASLRKIKHGSALILNEIHQHFAGQQKLLKIKQVFIILSKLVLSVFSFERGSKYLSSLFLSFMPDNYEMFCLISPRKEITSYFLLITLLTASKKASIKAGVDLNASVWFPKNNKMWSIKRGNKRGFLHWMFQRSLSKPLRALFSHFTPRNYVSAYKVPYCTLR